MSQWTIRELGERVEQALADDYAGPANGRIRAVPDARTIRYYTTLGLIDRPAAMRGRTALYGERHLRQLVAIKRLQAQGRSLADVQQALAGIRDDELARIARIDVSAVESTVSAPKPEPRAAAFWLAEPSDDDEDDVPSDEGDHAIASPAAAASASPRVLSGVELAPGVALVFDAAMSLSSADAQALARAAAPLIEELRAQGRLSLHTEQGE